MTAATATRYGAVNTDVDTSKPENDGPGYKFLRFYSQKASIAVACIGVVGAEISDGHPVMTERVPTGEITSAPGQEDVPVKETVITDVKDAPFLVLQELQYWASKPSEAPYEVTGTWLKKQAFKAEYDGVKVKEAFIAQILILLDSGPVLALAEVIGTKARFLSENVVADLDSTSKEFRKANPDLCKQTKGRARFRQVGRFNIIPKSGAWGAWSYAAGAFDATTAEQLAAIDGWLNDSGKEAERDTFQALFDDKEKKIKELAEKTPAL